ncbi:MAG: L,D-transpeptidase family protein, partial [Schleiferiaceae bacterium]|nr:L,D-transpeptidase family protein [Schleiferiaceae bacterium]
ASGDIGPKRKQGDYQVPEGFYSIDRFNPQSTYHLSLGLNYPNQSDKILSSKTSPGGNIFIHGSCVSAGCLAITDEWIEELYVYCVEAQNNGGTIQVTIFPFKPSVENMMYNTLGYPELKHEFSLWTDLKRGYDQFNESYELPNVQFNEDGSHTII